MRAWLTIGLCLVIAFAMGRCGGADDADPGAGIAIDEDAGTVDGVSVFNDTAAIEAALGKWEQSYEPLSWKGGWLSSPGVVGSKDAQGFDVKAFRYCDPSKVLAANPDVELASNEKRPPGDGLAYQDFVFSAWRGIVCDVAVTGKGATTAAGLKIGDSFDRAVELYPDFDCGEHLQPDAKLADSPVVPACAGLRGSEEAPVSVWITGDPVSEIWIGGTDEWMRTPRELP